MARRRLVDPTIWQSGHSKRLNFRQRLLWVGVITNADDEGKLKGEPAVIKSQVFPYDRLALQIVEADLQQLQTEGLIEQYVVGKDRYIRIVKWDKYQKPSHPTPSKIPDPQPAHNSGGALEDFQSFSGNPLEKDRAVKGKEDKISEDQRSPSRAGSASALAGAKASPALQTSPPSNKSLKGINHETLASLRDTLGGTERLKAYLLKQGYEAQEVHGLCL